MKIEIKIGFRLRGDRFRFRLLPGQYKPYLVQDHKLEQQRLIVFLDKVERVPVK